jgi:hypothetical protein
MAKKKSNKLPAKRGRPSKSSSSGSGSGSGKSSGKKSSKKKPSKKVQPKSKSSSKYQKKRGRKPSSPNRYNEIKRLISQYYETSLGRKVKRYEIKVIYNWIKSTYGNQSLRYILMNIDVILDTFWEEYCNLYPVNIENFARFYDWWYFKNFIYEEVQYHYPTDIIRVDLSQIGQGIYEFFMDDYVRAVDELYQIGKAAGLKDLESPHPKYYLINGYCDVARRGNVFDYILLVDGEIPDNIVQVTLSPTPTPETTEAPVAEAPVTEPVTDTAPPVTDTAPPTAPPATSPQDVAVAQAKADEEKAKAIQKALEMLMGEKITQEQFDKIIELLSKKT